MSEVKILSNSEFIFKKRRPKKNRGRANRKRIKRRR